MIAMRYYLIKSDRL